MDLLYLIMKSISAELIALDDTELWRYNPNQGGSLPVRVRDLNTSDSSTPDLLSVINGRLYFFADASSDGNYLYEYSASGDLNKVADIGGQQVESTLKNPVKSACSKCYASVGDVIVFAADDINGDARLWRHVPGEAVKDVVGLNGVSDSETEEFITFNDWVYFSAEDSEHGRELWMYDPSNTTNIPQLAQDIIPGSAGSNPTDFIVVEDALCFFADDGIHGKEPMCLHAWE